jgi:hypothetical protein
LSLSERGHSDAIGFCDVYDAVIGAIAVFRNKKPEAFNEACRWLMSGLGVTPQDEEPYKSRADRDDVVTNACSTIQSLFDEEEAEAVSGGNGDV